MKVHREDRKRNPADPHVRHVTWGAVSHRRDLLDSTHRPRTLKEYQHALYECEKGLREEGRGWEILDPDGRSYMRAIADRRELLRGDASWSKLDTDSQKRLKGSYKVPDLEWTALLGRMTHGSGPAVLNNEWEIRASLEAVLQARDHEFPDIVLPAMRRLRSIQQVGRGTATLLLTIARPDRLLSVNNASADGLAALGEPESYQELLRWLYDQPWYADGPRRIRTWRQSGTSGPRSSTPLCGNSTHRHGGHLSASGSP